MTARTKLPTGLQAALLLLVGVWVYFPALHGGWVWDDFTEVAQNPVLAHPGGLREIWLNPPGADYFPLKTTLQWLEWRAWGARPFGFHLVTLALHLASALLFWRLLARWGVPWAWLGGLLLAVHPVAVESAAWIAETKNTLSLALALLAAHAYWDFNDRSAAGRPREARGAYLWALALFLAALLAKSTVVMLPALLLLALWWRRGRPTRADVAASLPFFALSLALGLVTIWFQRHRAMAGADVGVETVASRLAGAGLAIAFYLGKFMAPAGLMPNYPRWNLAPLGIADFLPWVGLIALAAWGLARRSPARRAILFGVGAFVLSLAPVLGLVPMAYLRISRVADHFDYFPLLGLAGLAAAGAGTLAARPGWRGPMLAIAAAGCAALAVASHRYAGIFRDDETFWTYAVARNPASWLGHNDLGLKRAAAGRWPEAIAEYEQAIRLNPGYAEARNNLGGALAVSGRLPSAIDQFTAALRLQPDYLEARIDLGNALGQSGRWAEAAEQYGVALRRVPANAELHCRLGLVLEAAGRLPDAMAEYAEALRLRPDYAEAHYRLGNALGNTGRLAEAIQHYREAIRLTPGYAEAHANLGLALASGPRPAEGVAELREALRLQPDSAVDHAYLGFALAQAGQFPEAVREDQAALRLDPNNADVKYNLEAALRAVRR